ncbi:hypothetical protein KOE80_10935 [Alcaligenes sp. 13f]|uniref:hypothetical protein n=1 Tax=Alcaligenes sp. 13f TaxID=2841924 RepID=UPI001CF70488|nr:hypothetical protein [Alcaligenes sp. 13f]MCB4322714.1 hypothetical protein [Alcaligenes sp. 13f]
MKQIRPSAEQKSLHRHLTQGQLNLARASAVYEHKSLINMEARSAFRVAEFRKLVDR